MQNNSTIKNRKTTNWLELFQYYCYRIRQLCTKQGCTVYSKNGERIVFSIENSTCMWRAKTLFTKEKETIAWINHMQKDALLWDIGANIGVYTLYAAKQGIRCVSFEPSASSYYVLNKNIYMNKLQDKAIAYNFALSDNNALGAFYMNLIESGHALHPGFKGETQNKEGQYQQGMFGISIDSLVEDYHLEVPEYIKIDVDGYEESVIYGAERTLKNEKIKSILVEVDFEGKERHKRLINFIESAGFRIYHYPGFKESYQNGNMTNYIFRRNSKRGRDVI